MDIKTELAAIIVLYWEVILKFTYEITIKRIAKILSWSPEQIMPKISASFELQLREPINLIQCVSQFEL